MPKSKKFIYQKSEFQVTLEDSLVQRMIPEVTLFLSNNLIISLSLNGFSLFIRSDFLLFRWIWLFLKFRCFKNSKISSIYIMRASKRKLTFPTFCSWNWIEQ